MRLETQPLISLYGAAGSVCDCSTPPIVSPAAGSKPFERKKAETVSTHC